MRKMVYLEEVMEVLKEEWNNYDRMMKYCDEEEARARMKGDELRVKEFRDQSIQYWCRRQAIRNAMNEMEDSKFSIV